MRKCIYLNSVTYFVHGKIQDRVNAKKYIYIYNGSLM